MASRTRTRNISETLTAGLYSKLGATVTDRKFKKTINQYETLTDSVTPGYFAMLKSGAILPMNPATKTAFKVVNRVPSVWGYDVRTAQGKPYGSVRYSGVSALGKLGALAPGFSPDNFPSFSEHDVSAMYTDALAAAKTQGMDVLTFYAELSKTITMVTGLAGRVLQRAHDIVKIKKLHRIKDKKAFISAFSDSWLEYRYGWRILAYDIEDIQEIIRKLDEGISLRFKAKRGNLKENIVLSQSGTSSNLAFLLDPSGTLNGNGNIYRHNYKIDETHSIRGHAGVLIESYLRSVITVDPLLTGYELVPYSFVADWFFNFNQFLAAVSPLLDERIIQAYSRIDLVKTKRFEVGPTPEFTSLANEKWTPFGGPSSLTIESVTWTRSNLTVNERQLVLDYDNTFDRLKAADALALLWGRLRALRKFTTI